MSVQKADPARWAVSKSRNRALSQPLTGVGDSHRVAMMANAFRDVQSEAEVVAEIDKLWGEAQDKFLAIGRYLVLAKTQFHRTYEATILPSLPFGKGVAFQLRAVATAVDEGRILEEEMPRSYATAYQLVSLPPSEFDLARKENLVRPNVLRREVAAFRSRIRQRDVEDRDALSREKEQLEAEARKIAKRLREIEAVLG